MTKKNFFFAEFRWTSRKYHLVYANHFDIDAYRAWLQANIGIRTIVALRIAQELGHEVENEEEEGGQQRYQHTHVCLELDDAPDWTGANKLDYVYDENGAGNLITVHPHVKIVRTQAQWKNTWEYVFKQENTLARHEEGSCEKKKEKEAELQEFRQWIWSKRTWLEVLRGTEHQHLLSRHLKLAEQWWSARPKDNLLESTVLEKWQQEVINLISEGLIHF